MKRNLIFYAIFLFLPVAFFSCNSKVNNKFAFKNLAAGDVYVNFRGVSLTVPVGQTREIIEIPQGTYSYNTTYEIPAGATSGSATGPLSGTVIMKAGTRILLIYSSTFEQSTYKIGATISSSDDLNPPTLTGP